MKLRKILKKYGRGRYLKALHKRLNELWDRDFYIKRIYLDESNKR